MAIFDLIVDQTLGLYDTRDFVEIFEPMFDELDADVDNYDWDMDDLDTLQDLESVRINILRNLIFAAQDSGIFPEYVDADDFDLDDGIIFDMSGYEETQIGDIKLAIEEFSALTGLTIDIEE